jgi:nitronate monooxygenase
MAADRLPLRSPVVQAGMGGLSGHELAAAVSEAGGLGTIAVLGADSIARELTAARRLTDQPIAVNLLLPLARGSWFRAAESADLVVTFWGRPRRRVGTRWLHQAGSVTEAEAAAAAGADGVILQGVEAGGHVRGTTPALELLERARTELPPDYPLLLAGGIAESTDVQRALDAGAIGAVAGTRFLLSEESEAHPDYKRRLLAADETLLTEVFGFGWPGPHRVVPNEATRRCLGDGGEPPRLNRLLNRVSALGARYAPEALQRRLADVQRPGGHLLSPTAVTTHAPDSLVEAGALYAGETVARIVDIRPARELVQGLTP